MEVMTSRLTGESLPPVCIETLSGLSPSARIAVWGFWPETPIERVQAEIAGLETSRLIEAVRSVSGFERERISLPVESLFEAFGHSSERLRLGVDLGPRPSPAVSLVFLTTLGLGPSRDQKLGNLLSRLVAAGICSSRKAEALWHWPGAALDPDPPAWSLAAVRQDDGLVPLLHRRISHIKVTYAPGIPPTAKAYLIFWHTHARLSTLWRPPAGPSHA
jgi:hypothetical protein